MRKGSLALAAGLAAAAALAAPAGARAPACPAAWKAGWQRLADRIKAPVYCPGWLPGNLAGEIGGPNNNIDSVDPDRSYLIGFVWQEAGSEVHVNLRGYPGQTRIPSCEDTITGSGPPRKRRVPCFADAGGAKTARGIRATVYTVNQGADQWHVLYAWRRGGSLYTISEHVAPPFGYAKVIENLDRALRSLVLVTPKSS